MVTSHEPLTLAPLAPLGTILGVGLFLDDMVPCQSIAAEVLEAFYRSMTSTKRRTNHPSSAILDVNIVTLARCGYASWGYSQWTDLEGWF